MSQELERGLAEAELTLPQFNVLMELAATTGGALPSTSSTPGSSPPPEHVVDHHADGEGGLAIKRRDAEDGRVVILALTEAGWAALERALPLVVEAERRLLAGYDRRELRTLAEMLSRLTAGTDR